MRILLLVISILLNASVHAQPRVELDNMDVAFKSRVDELKYCIKETKNDCSIQADALIQEGIAKQVPYLDYLYFQKAFYFMHRNELDSAIYYCEQSLKHPHPIEKYRSDLECYNTLANCYYYKGDLEKANNYYIEVAKILERGGNPLHLGYLYSNMATLLGEIGNDDKQIAYLHKSFQLLEANKDERFIATIASNLALGYFYKHDTAKVVQWANKALELGTQYHDLVAMVQGYFCLSHIDTSLQKSLMYAEKAVKYADELGDKIHQSTAYYRYAEALYQTGNRTAAIDYAEKSIDFSQEIGDIITLAKASITAANLYYSLGMKDKAADHYHRYNQYHDSIISVDNKRLINDLNTKYETEKKENQIAAQALKIQTHRANLLYTLLGAALLAVILGALYYNKQRAQQSKYKQLQQEKENAILNSFILGEERERKRISHELHDGVAAMIAAAQMNLDVLPHLTEEQRLAQVAKVKAMLEHTHADVRHIAHNLLPTVLEKEGLVRATLHFAYEISQTKLLQIQVTDQDSQAENLAPQLQLMLFRVIQELVNNIVKHSKAQNADIIFSNHAGSLQIEITDDGIGYEDKEQSGNQGLYSIMQRLKTIGGNFIIHKRSTGGTQAKVEVAIAK